MSDKIHFGSPSCSSIEVDPFTPICSYPDIDPSSALTLDVPVPRFAPIIPPNECACFDFSTGTVTPTVASCLEQASVSIEIRPLDADCCTGRYGIFPSVSIPCMPFDIATPTVNVHTKTGDTGNVDGNASFQIIKGDPPNCCQLETTLDITLPECVKTVPDPVEQQITWTDNAGVAHTHQLVSLVRDELNCTVYPTITPLPLPDCLLRDGTLCSGNFSLDKYGGSATWTLTRKNCDISLDIQASPGTIPVPAVCTTELRMASEDLVVKYKDQKGAEKTKTIEDFFTLSRYPATGGCPCYTLTMGTLDLGSIVGFSSGGDVFMDAGGGASYGDLFIDGNSNGDTAWYGGGLGNLLADVVNVVECRGPTMRGVSGPFSDTQLVPNVFVDTQMISNTHGAARTWSSARKGSDASGNTVRVLPNEITIDGQTVACVTGNLSMVMPTSFQWDAGERGMTVPLSEFVWNQSGVLAYVQESHEGAIVAPGLAKAADGSHVSGLKAYPTGARVDDMPLYGLHVDYGPGLRIRKNENEFYNHPSTNAGALTPNLGRGVKLSSCPSKPLYDNKIEIRADGSDFYFTASSNNPEQAKIALSDAAAPGGTTYYSGDDNERPTWVRHGTTELVLRVISSGRYGYDGTLQGFNFAYLRFLRNGTLLGVSQTRYGADALTRSSETKVTQCAT